jgi:hypothetical protein
VRGLTGESVGIVRLHNVDQPANFGPHPQICRCMRNHGERPIDRSLLQIITSQVCLTLFNIAVSNPARI